MLSTLESVIQRLVDEYEPDRIILFGSRATGRSDSGSDFDLLVVKETAQRPIDRRCEVEKLLADRAVPLDLVVYTPSEMRMLHATGSPFLEEVFRTGKVVFMRKPTSAWVGQAHDELESAEILLENKKYQAVCYHSQQCAEKALKALLVEKAADVPRVHDIVDLRTRVLALGWRISLSVDDAVFLNSIYRGRYPTEEGLLPYGEPALEDSRRAFEAAQLLLKSVDAELGPPGTGESGRST